MIFSLLARCCHVWWRWGGKREPILQFNVDYSKENTHFFHRLGGALPVEERKWLKICTDAEVIEKRDQEKIYGNCLNK